MLLVTVYVLLNNCCIYAYLCVCSSVVPGERKNKLIKKEVNIKLKINYKKEIMYNLVSVVVI